jgi:hypothetical protein
VAEAGVATAAGVAETGIRRPFRQSPRPSHAIELGRAILFRLVPKRPTRSRHARPNTVVGNSIAGLTEITGFNLELKNVRILASISEFLDPVSRPRPYSAKTHGDLERATACRKTCGFMVSAGEAPLDGNKVEIAGLAAATRIFPQSPSRATDRPVSTKGETASANGR